MKLIPLSFVLGANPRTLILNNPKLGHYRSLRPLGRDWICGSKPGCLTAPFAIAVGPVGTLDHRANGADGDSEG